MENVTVLKAVLIEKVSKNRATHIYEYAETINGYRIKVDEIMSAEASKANLWHDVDFSAIYKLAQKPESHEKEYDRALAMLEMSVDDQITLTQQEFEQLVMDEWQWKQAFTLSGSLYKTK
jgi:hypothetical protein